MANWENEKIVQAMKSLKIAGRKCPRNRGSTVGEKVERKRI